MARNKDIKLCVVYSSHLEDSVDQVFEKHLKDTAGTPIHIERIENKNQYSLTEAYNIGWKRLDDLKLSNRVIVFCHNDITIKTKDWGKILVGLFANFGAKFDILGVAGTTEFNEHGVWWLDKQGQMNFPKMCGRVWHTNGIRESESIYSEKIREIIRPVVVADGLFLAVNGESEIISRFDEKYKNFHYYDISFCFQNYLEGCNIGVIDRISILHQSVGMTNAHWEANRQQFLEQYKDELPVTVSLA